MTFTHEDPPIDGQRLRATDAPHAQQDAPQAQQDAPHAQQVTQAGQTQWPGAAQQPPVPPWPAANPWPVPSQQHVPQQHVPQQEAPQQQDGPQQPVYRERTFAPRETEPRALRQEGTFVASAAFPAPEAPPQDASSRPGEDTMSARQRRAMEAMRTAGTGPAPYAAPAAAVPPAPAQYTGIGRQSAPTAPASPASASPQGGGQFAAEGQPAAAARPVASPSGPWGDQQYPTVPPLRSQPRTAQPSAGQPSTGQPVAGQPVAGQPYAAQPPQVPPLAPSAPEGYGTPTLSDYPSLPIADTARSPFPTASVTSPPAANTWTGDARSTPSPQVPASETAFDPFSVRQPSGQQPVSGVDAPVPSPTPTQHSVQPAQQTGPQSPLHTAPHVSAWSSPTVQTGPQAVDAWPMPGGHVDHVPTAWQPPAYPEAPATVPQQPSSTVPQQPSVVIADTSRDPFPPADPGALRIPAPTPVQVPAPVQDAPVALIDPPVPTRRELRQQRAAERAPHWSEEVDHMTREPAGDGLGGSPTSSGPIAAHTLVVGAPDHLTGPLSSTGEVILTGSIELPRTFAETGSHARLDDAELDEIEANFDPGTQQQPQQNSPVRASRAVGSQYETDGIVKTKRGGMSSHLMSTLVIGTAVVLVLVVIAVAVVVGPMLFG